MRVFRQTHRRLCTNTPLCPSSTKGLHCCQQKNLYPSLSFSPYLTLSKSHCEVRHERLFSSIHAPSPPATSTTYNETSTANRSTSTSNNESNKICTKLQELSSQQAEFLSNLAELKNSAASEKGDNIASIAKEKEILMDLWENANEMDITLHHHYQTNLIRSFSNLSPTQSTANMKDFNKTIEAWKSVMDAYNSCIHDTNYYSLPAGIPQRATRLLDTMEKLAKKNDETSGFILPSKQLSSSQSLTIDTYNKVLEIWTDSKEFNLDTSAEMIFRRIENKFENTNGQHSMVNSFTADVMDTINQKKGHITVDNNISERIQPNPDTLKIMIRAWCKFQDDDERLIDRRSNSVDTQLQISSGQTNKPKNRKGSSVFNASWYLIQMQRLLESGRNEFEPSLEDYTKIFKAWSEVT